MQKVEWHILSTRPLPAALIEEAAGQHIFIEEISFIETTPVIDDRIAARIRELFQKPITAVFTSMNAVTAVASIPHASIPWNIYSIGHKTAALITELFQKPIVGTAADAAALADVMIKDGVKEVVFFCGNIRRDVLPDKLRKTNILVEEIVVYQTKELAQVVTKRYDAILFYSPSAVHSFFSGNKINTDTVLFAIGNTTAETIQQYTGNKIYTAAKPDKEDLVQEMIQHFNTKNKAE